MTSFVDSFSHHLSINLNNLSKKIESPLFRKRYLIFNIITYISTQVSNLFFTRIPPFGMIGVIHVAYLIDRVTSALFATLLEPFRNVPYIPALGQAAHLYISFRLSRTFCVMNRLIPPQTKLISIIAIGLISMYCSIKLIT